MSDLDNFIALRVFSEELQKANLHLIERSEVYAAYFIAHDLDNWNMDDWLGTDAAMDLVIKRFQN